MESNLKNVLKRFIPGIGLEYKELAGANGML